MVTLGYLLPLKLVTIFSIKTKRGLAGCCACFEIFQAAPATPSAQRCSCEGSLLKGSLNFSGHQPHLNLKGSDLGAVCGPSCSPPHGATLTRVGLCSAVPRGAARRCPADVGVSDSQGDRKPAAASEPWRNRLQPRQLRPRGAGGDGTQRGERLRLRVRRAREGGRDGERKVSGGAWGSYGDSVPLSSEIPG